MRLEVGNGQCDTQNSGEVGSELTVSPLIPLELIGEVCESALSLAEGGGHVDRTHSLQPEGHRKVVAAASFQRGLP